MKPNLNPNYYTNMSKLGIKSKFKKYINQDADTMGQEGLMLAGLAVLMEDIQKLEYPWAMLVEQFHRKYRIDYAGLPRMLPSDMSAFRIARSIEEHKEYMEAKNVEEKLDAIIDHIYILLGTAHAHGFNSVILAEAFKRVHEANMAKVRASKENPGKYGIHGDAFDIVKPPGWTPPDLSDLVANAV